MTSTSNANLVETENRAENLKKVDIKAVPTLNLYKPLRDSLSLSVENSSLSSRVKRRTQINKSLEFSHNKFLVSASKYVKASHEIGYFNPPPPLTTRRKSNNNAVVIKNRHVSRNLFLDQFPA